MTVSEIRREDGIQLDVDGRVDTNSSPQLQTYILQAFQKSNKVIINMEKVDYISSAGLRALLIGQKTALSKGGSMVVVHVCDEVMKVFKLTGFNNVLNIE